ncbi:unnamed protein product [Phytophthora lilii]|uniref:Unnamed protein product n=1 Tax=Phytophthora lilii TaxID=2077276 RepID=A0A9W6WLR2_9STRA|nr:unnamed protein product [Phytophthora lilii]
MAGESVCVFDGDSSGQETPVGFRDTPGQWYTANHRKRAALSQLEGEPTQRESQATQVATQVATEVSTEMATQAGASVAPVFVAATPSPGDNDDSQQGEDEVDEEETQIRMTNSEEQDAPKPERKIFEEAVPLPIAATASGSSKSFGDTRMENSDNDADSDMSDDMLEQDGSVAGLSSIAASFRQREEIQKVVEKKIYKPRIPFRSSPALPARDDSDSSGGETEIEGEPKEESPAKENRPKPTEGLSLRLTKSASYSKALESEDASTPLRRSQSTPDRTQKLSLPPRSSKREHSEASPHKRNTTAKRSRHSDETLSTHSLVQEAALNKRQTVEKCGEEELHKQTTVSNSESNVAEEEVEDSPDDEKREASIKVAVPDKVLSSHSAPQLKSPTSSRGRKRAASSRSVTDSESAGSQAEAGSIRIILTGLELTTAIRKKIKSIAGAVYESNIEKATHVIAPQNQLKRTVKLLCGISCCTHILGERWLDESARAGAAVDEQANCLRNEEAETKWQFDLRSTMYGVPAAQRQRLFAGQSVFITNHKSVLPPVKDLAKIVECAGGKASVRGKPGPKDLLITSETAMTVAAVRKQLASANPERIYSPELILISILQQRIDLDKHRLKRPAIGKTWATKRKS